MISLERYLEGIESIYVEQPKYETGHDGSDGLCDCIGMIKGAIRRAGGDASGLSGTNYAARNTIRNLSKLVALSQLTVGDVVMKTRQPGEPGYSLPEKYKSSGDLTDYYHIGTVTNLNPLRITHMTDPAAKIDTKLGKWNRYGQLPQVARTNPDPYIPDPPVDPIPEPMPEVAIVIAEKGKNVNLRKSPSTASALVERVPLGETVTVLTHGEDWSQVKWKWYTGWMMTKFLLFEDMTPSENTYTVTIPGLTREQAEMLCNEWQDAMISVG